MRGRNSSLRKLWIGCAALALGTTQAHTAWQKVSSPHFVIYADGEPDKLRAFATRLEKFDKAVRVVRTMPDPTRSLATATASPFSSFLMLRPSRHSPC